MTNGTFLFPDSSELERNLLSAGLSVGRAFFGGRTCVGAESRQGHLEHIGLGKIPCYSKKVKHISQSTVLAKFY